jgi:hypothetical protein
VLDALAAPCEPSLRARLGADADDALQAALRDHARSWARAAGGGAEPLEVAAVAELPGALDGVRGPVVLVAPDVPALGDAHLAAVHDDLAAGVLLSSAATGDGTPFLIALSAMTPDLLATAGATFNEVLAIAASHGRELGMLRAERRLSTIADAHALLADPLTRPELRTLLAPLAVA